MNREELKLLIKDQKRPVIIETSNDLYVFANNKVFFHLKNTMDRYFFYKKDKSILTDANRRKLSKIISFEIDEQKINCTLDEFIELLKDEELKGEISLESCY